MNQRLLRLLHVYERFQDREVTSEQGINLFAKVRVDERPCFEHSLNYDLVPE